MEDQGKRLLLAVAIAFALMLGWSLLFPSEPPPPPPDGDEVAEEMLDRPDREAAPGEVRDPADPADPPERRGQEELFELEFPDFRATFSSYGGSLVSWELLGERYRDPHREGRPMDMVPAGELGHEQLRSFVVAFDEQSTFRLPRDAEWRGERRGENAISFSWDSRDLSIEKLYELDPDRYLLQMTVRVTNRSDREARQRLSIVLHGYQDPAIDAGGGWTRLPREWEAACLVGSDVQRVSFESLAAQREPRTYTGELFWSGFTHSYFLMAAAPNREEEPQASRFDCLLSASAAQRGAMRAEIVYPDHRLAAGSTYERSSIAYLGPKYLGTLEELSAGIAETEGFTPKFEEAVDLGWLAFLVRPLLWLLKWFQGIVVNWGLAIILLTVLVKLVTLPWTHKSMKSMKAMAALKPEMEEIREKYKDDKQRQQIETMNLFKQHKVNPLAGCLPILLQMPIWIALYRSLTVAGELYQAPFIPGWINDLTLPDPYYIMPVLLTGTMFLQSKFTPMTATGMQQKMLQYGMPLMFGVFSFFFPAGLTLYIFTNTILTAAHHVYVRRGDKPAARVAGRPPAPKGPKGSDKPVGKGGKPADEGDDGDEIAASDGRPGKAEGGQPPRKKKGKKGGRKRRKTGSRGATS